MAVTEEKLWQQRFLSPGLSQPGGAQESPRGFEKAQLKEKRYADKYRGLGRPIYLIAVEFSREARNLTAFEVEEA